MKCVTSFFVYVGNLASVRSPQTEWASMKQNALLELRPKPMSALALPCLALPCRAPCPVCSAGEKGTHRNRTCNALQRHQIIRFFYPFFANDDMEGIVVCICIRFWMPPPLPGAGKYWQTMNFKMPEVFRTFLVSYLCNLYILFLSC